MSAATHLASNRYPLPAMVKLFEPFPFDILDTSRIFKGSCSFVCLRLPVDECTIEIEFEAC